MKQEFLDVYETLFNDSFSRLRRFLMLKLKAMRICAEREKKSKRPSQINRVQTVRLNNSDHYQNISH